MNPQNERSQEKDQKKDTGYSKSSAPSISLPKGGGAMKGIDEKFSVNAVNGTSGMTIPVPGLKTRSDFAPGLTLSYNSGSGNSEFGLGWGLSLPSIQRKTDKRLPEYNDAAESDVFLFAGAEDLVPVTGEETNPVEIMDDDILLFTVTKYRPRIEGLFARIEKIRPAGESYVYWKVTTKDNITTFFGLDTVTRLVDPDYPDRIFKWLPDISFDDKGNCHVYDYKQENLDGVRRHVHEQHRHNETQSFANVYLKKIRYGNDTTFYIDSDNPYRVANPHSTEFPLEGSFLYTTVFDYGEHDTDVPTIDEDDTWPCRFDPFSDYHAGFEIRTYRLCKRILCFSHMEELTEETGLTGARLVQSLNLTYKYDDLLDEPDTLLETDYIIEATHWMYKWNGSEYDKRRLPPMVFTYNEVEWDTSIHNISKENLVNAPTGLSSGYQWMDFYGEGISGILTEQVEGWFYKSNWGDGTFSPAQKIAPKPNFAGLQLQDLEANGKKYAVSNTHGTQGFFELDDDDKWQNFRAFKNIPNIDLNDPNSRMLDLNGDGIPDILISQERVFTYYESKGTEGYGEPKTSSHPLDENKGPAIVFADSVQSIFLADMSGDGMTDIVRIRNKDVCYWPNLGYGRFGAKVTMSNAPLMDKSDQFNPAYIHLSDISGTGASDLIYLGKNQFRAWLNLSGNGWSDVKEISPFPQSELPNTLSVIDLLGNGTSCLVWSSAWPQYSNAPMRYIDLMGGNKPYLMKQYSNSAGKQVTLTYKSSTHYYLEDKKLGKPWITKLPFPVHCVQRTEIKDLIADTTYSNLYSYHHGYYDHAEREFRGFGRVETLDSESFVNPSDTGYLDEPPILTKTWYHTGAWIREDKILNQYKTEYFNPVVYTEDPDTAEHDLVQPAMPGDWTAIEQREALRAFKGVPLRQEVYAQDGTDKEPLPYSTTEYNYDIQQLQPKGNNRFAVYLVHEKENIGYHYERDAADPRIAHSLNIVIDEYANVLEAASVVYGRREIPDGLPSIVEDEQEKVHIIYTKNEYTNDVTVAAAYRLRLPWKANQFELTGSIPAGDYFTINELYEDFDNADEIEYSQMATTGLQKRLIESQFTLFYTDALTVSLSEGELESKAIPYESYRLALTRELVEGTYRQLIPDPPLPTPPPPTPLYHELISDSEDVFVGDGKYVVFEYDVDDQPKSYWIPSGTILYTEDNYDDPDTANSIDPAENFYLPMRYTDPFGNRTHVRYYSNYHLLLQYTKDELDNITSIGGFEWRVLQPTLLVDINDNGTSVAYNILGLPVGIALFGGGTDSESGTDADTLEGFVADRDGVFDIIDIFDSPEYVGNDFLQNATTRFVYDFEGYINWGIPLRVISMTREQHKVDNETPPLQFSLEYSDGLGRVLMKKVNAEPGDFLYMGSGGVETGNTMGELRWVGTGRTILNNKGKPIKQYEPYFSGTPAYETDSALVEIGFSPVIYYDPMGRVIRTDMPDGTFSKVEFDAWMQKTYDANDTVNDSQWKIDRSSGGDLYSITEEVDALTKTANHSADTPTTVYTDSLGRPFYTVLHNKIWDGSTLVDQMIPNYVLLDIESNTKEVVDGRGLTQFVYRHDMLGNVIYQKSIDSGEQWMVNDVFGKTLFAWDTDLRRTYMEYDELHRPITKEVELFDDPEWGNRIVLERMVYGEAFVDATNNLRGKLHIQYDGAGRVQVDEYDFKGNPKATKRVFVEDGTVRPDWDAPSSVTMETESSVEKVYSTTTIVDALNRPVDIITPDDGHTLYTYSKGGLLYSVDVTDVRDFDSEIVNSIEYNAKGQRTHVIYKNGAETIYEYDPKTYRLIHLNTSSGSDNVQDLYYWYDPVGNITTQTDAATQTIYFAGAEVTPHNFYTYDALYRLIKAEGREHDGLGVSETLAPKPAVKNDGYRVGRSHPNDSSKMRRYVERYKYDEVGNMLRQKHYVTGGTANWTRDYTIDAVSNRLLECSLGSYGSGSEDYEYDSRGNLANVPWQMTYNSENSLEIADVFGEVYFHYQYDSGGQRVRKTYTDSIGAIKEVRKYIGNWEVFSKFTSGSLTSERETLHIADDAGRIALIDSPVISEYTGDDQLLRYQYSNHLGTATLELDEDGYIISYEEYYPFGSTSFQSGRNSAEVSLKRYRFTGKEQDWETGLYYHGARYYIPWLCRWCAVDPMESKYAGMSSYNYSLNNPIMLNDPNGADPVPDPNKKSSPKGKKTAKKTDAKPATPATKKANESSSLSLNPSPVLKDGPLVGADRSQRQTQIDDVNKQRISKEEADKKYFEDYPIIAADMYGVGQIGKRKDVEAKIANIKQAHSDQIAANIAGPLGNLGYILGGEKWSAIGAGFDGVVASAGYVGTLKGVTQKPDNTSKQKNIPATEQPIESKSQGPAVGTKFTVTLQEAQALKTEVLPRAERLSMLRDNLSKASNPTNPKEALSLINKTLDNIELKHSGENDRMFGILDNMYVKYHSNGSVTARTTGHRIEIQPNGMFSIFERKTGNLFYKK